MAHVQQLWLAQGTSAAQALLQILIFLLLFVSLQMKTHVRAQKFHWLIWLNPLRRIALRLVRNFVTRVKQVTWGRRVPPISSHAFKMAAWSNGQSATSSVNVRFLYLFFIIWLYNSCYDILVSIVWLLWLTRLWLCHFTLKVKCMVLEQCGQIAVKRDSVFF